MEQQQTQSAAGEKLIRILAVTMVISVMNATMFNIVLPEIKEDFRLSLGQVSWVFTIYTLIYAIGSVIYGKLADTYKLKNLLTFGMVLLLLGSLAGLTAPAFGMVLLGRGLQAAGAAVIPALGMIIPVRYFPPERRGRALGISATGLALGNAIGPVVSGLIGGMLDWRWLFCTPVLILFTLPFYRRYLQDERTAKAKIDWIGAVLLAGTVTSLLLAVTQGGWTPAVASLIFLILFIVRIQTAAEPFIQARLFANKSYSLGLIVSVCVMGVGYALPFLSPQFLSGINHLSPLFAGITMVPGTIAAAILGRSAGKLADAKGNPFLFYMASTLLLICFLCMSTFVGSSPVVIAIVLVFGTVGQTFMQIAMSNSISRTLPKEQAGVGMGMLTMLNFLAGAVSTAIYSRVVDQGSSVHWNPFNDYPSSNTFSNIYIVLFFAYVLILWVYHFQFGKRARE
ncbi:MFS transporter [Paenibacillus sp. M1]|uniref:MFS transporter n=1 Tax=Paenibacillus haidiansis TaxID=1574488 RepID=A0ABU7VPR6_9BACL